MREVAAAWAVPAAAPCDRATAVSRALWPCDVRIHSTGQCKECGGSGGEGTPRCEEAHAGATCHGAGAGLLHDGRAAFTPCMLGAGRGVEEHGTLIHFFTVATINRRYACAAHPFAALLPHPRAAPRPHPVRAAAAGRRRTVPGAPPWTMSMACTSCSGTLPTSPSAWPPCTAACHPRCAPRCCGPSGMAWPHAMHSIRRWACSTAR